MMLQFGSLPTGIMKAIRMAYPNSDLQVAADRNRPDSQRISRVPSVFAVAAGRGRAI